jgi:hypothetical protein
MTQELPALSKLSFRGPTESEKMTAHDEHPSTVEVTKTAVWRPRWRGNPDAKPTPYKPKPSKDRYYTPTSSIVHVHA